MPFRDPEKRRVENHRYYVANLGKVAEHQRKYRAANRAKRAEAIRLWRAANPERVAGTKRRYCAANPEKGRANVHKRRALKKGNGGSYTVAEWQALCTQYNNECIGPGPHGGELERDHVIPVIDGGTSDITNVQPLCRRCNRRKGKKTIDYRCTTLPNSGENSWTLTFSSRF